MRIAISAGAVFLAVALILCLPTASPQANALGPPVFTVVAHSDFDMQAAADNVLFPPSTEWNPFKKKGKKPAPKPKASGKLVGPADARFVLIE